MCVICISPKGIRQPNKKEMMAMFDHNPDGAGYMFAKDGLVEIHKGFMNFDDFYRAICEENFTNDDVVVYHFRISTQGGVNPYMCHPFPLTAKLENTKILDCLCPMGIAHNGIIPCTTDYTDKEYSDTARFITEYLARLIKDADDIHDTDLMNAIERLIKSRMVFMTGNGEFTTVGKWTTVKSGLIYSNLNHEFTPNYVNLFDKHTWIYNDHCKRERKTK